ncbi:MAG: hypothetical protein CM15mP65_01950 [Crocinitomicaceae bacterium]|nr:MAG: hypothetical protein CM15mP65_01950 [Crocinitomicaceae bacterium]
MKRITTLLVNVFITGLLTSNAQFNFENQIEKRDNQRNYRSHIRNNTI